MKQLTLIVCAVAVLLLPLRAGAQSAHGDSRKATIAVTGALVVGTTVLKPGEYRFQCREFQGKTYLVVTSTESDKEIARVPCVKEALDAKVAASELRAVVTGGVRELKSVRIKGETVAHTLVP